MNLQLRIQRHLANDVVLLAHLGKLYNVYNNGADLSGFQSMEYRKKIKLDKLIREYTCPEVRKTIVKRGERSLER